MPNVRITGARWPISGRARNMALSNGIRRNSRITSKKPRPVLESWKGSCAADAGVAGATGEEAVDDDILLS